MFRGTGLRRRDGGIVVGDTQVRAGWGLGNIGGRPQA